jgi:hypothetical protein
MVVKAGFVVKVLGVGGRVVVVPRARDGVGGLVGRKVRRCADGLSGCGNVYMLLFEERVLRVRRRRSGCGFWRSDVRVRVNARSIVGGGEGRNEREDSY